MEKKSKIRRLLISVIMGLPLMVYAQRVFYCDSTASKSERIVISECKLFYNLSTNQMDSVQMVDFELDTVFALPLQIIAPVGNQNEINGVVFGLSKLDTVFKVEYYHGLVHGEFIRFCNRDTLCYTQFKHGKKNGCELIKTICNDPDYSITYYQDNIEVGPFAFIKNHKISFLTSIKDGKRDGAQYKNYDNGALEWYLVYKNGKVKNGTYYHFDESGKVIQADTYKKGKLRKTIKYYDDEPPKVTRYK